MKLIELTQGQVAAIDDEDYELVSRYRWYAVRARKTFYAVTKTRRSDGSRQNLRMHQLLMGEASNGRSVDHENLNGCDNRRSNLRWASPSQQRQNESPRVSNKSGFRGVSRRGNRWKATIGFERQVIHLGYFGSPTDAARAYNAKAVELFGTFARTNS